MIDPNVIRVARGYISDLYLHSNVEVSKHLVLMSSVKSIYERKIFPQKDIYGYLIFVDDMPMANWSHDCRYIFWVADGHPDNLVISATLPPMDIEMEEVTLEE